MGPGEGPDAIPGGLCLWRRGKCHYHVLAVSPRAEVNYDDPNDPITRRILSAYADL